MALETVTLRWDLTDLIQSGLSATLSITPTAQMSDSADHILIPPVARAHSFSGGTGSLAGIVPNDSEDILPSGTGYLISVTAADGQVIVPQFQTQLLSADADDDGVLWLDALAVVPSVTTTYQYLPLTTGAPSAGQVPVFTGSGYATEPGDSGAGGDGSGTVTTVSVATANGFAGTVADETTTPAISVKLGFTAGLVKAGTGGAASAATAGTDYVTPAGSGATLTGITAAQVGADASGAASAAQAAAEAASLSLASGGTVAGATAFTSTLTAETPTQASQVAIKSYVDSVAAGLDAKPSVTALAASNITLSGTQTIDGVAVTAGERVLAVGQSTSSQNGLWVAAAGSWSRPADFASASTQLGAFAFVEAGTANASSGWVLVGAAAATVDTDAQTWTQFSGAGEINAGTGLGKSGNTLSLSAPVSIANGGTGTASGAAQNGVFAGPASGGAGAPSFRAMVAADVPTLNQSTTGTAAGLSGTPALPNGTTATTQSGGDDSAKVATTAYTDTAVAGKVAKSGDTMTGKLSPTVTTVTFASTVTLPVTTNVLSLTLTGACTVNAPSSGNDGDLLRVRIIGADSHTVTWGAGWNWGTAGAPTLAGPRDRIVAEYVSSDPVWDASADLGH